MEGMSARLRSGWYHLVLAFCSLALAGCEIEPVALYDGVPTNPVKRDALYPKIVLQTLPTNGIELAAWTPDDRHIITAVGQTGTVAIWEVATGHIVDRLDLPADDTETGTVRRLRAMDVSEDGRTVIIDAETSSFMNNQFTPTRLRRYLVDLQDRSVEIVAAPETDEILSTGDQIEEITEALEMLYEDDDGEDRAEGWPEYILPLLPVSNDGKWELRRFAKEPYDLPDGSPAEGGLELVSTDGSGEIRRLVQPPMVKVADADLSLDGRWFAMLDDKMDHESEDDELGSTPLNIFDIEAAEFQPQIRLPGDYGSVQWLDDGKVLVSADFESSDRGEECPDEGEECLDRDQEPSQSTLADALVIDAESGVLELAMPGRCFMAATTDGTFFGTGTSNCLPSSSGDLTDRGIERFDSETQQWKAFGNLVLETETFINAMALSPDGTKLAVVTDDIDGLRTFHVIDSTTGEVLQSKQEDQDKYVDFIAKMDFDADGSRLLISVSRTILAWTFADNELNELPIETLDTTLMAGEGSLVAVGGESDDALALFDLAEGEQIGALDYGSITAGGFVPDKPLFWAFSEAGGVRIWDTRDWSELITAYFFYNQGFMAVTPEGRYDSNIHPYKAQFRWLAPDAPFQSLNPDTFSRDYYIPGIGWRWLACSIEENCDDAFDEVASITDLNRTLPDVTIREVEPSADDPAKAVVKIAIAEGVDPDAANGKTRSGIYDPRLFRNHQLTSDFGISMAGKRLDIAEWRETQRVKEDNGTVALEAEITLPTIADEEGDDTILISAYAFNEDRLKSETAEFRYTPPPLQPRQRRAYIVSIGIDHYRETRLNLSYAGSDARLMSERLGQIPGYEIRRLAIATAGDPIEQAQGANPPFVSKETVLSLLAILEGQDREAMLSKLQQQGIDASALEQATPDDLVILSYAGHGWADQRGEFFIVPSEASWADSSSTPQTDSLLSSLELAAALQGIDAGEIALIIDACHSAASVEDGSFKPGPLGDPGLGQLAFDKGVRILSATQADDVAFEDSRLRQGLLTYALAQEGLDPSGGWADSEEDLDEAVDLTEWLDYAVWRLPLLSEEVAGNRLGGWEAPGERGLVFFDDSARRAKPRIQKPSLFDFNVEPSRTVLLGSPR